MHVHLYTIYIYDAGLIGAFYFLRFSLSLFRAYCILRIAQIRSRLYYRVRIALRAPFEINIGKARIHLVNWIITFGSLTQTNQISTRSKVLVKVSFYFPSVCLARARGHVNLIAISNRIYLATIVE